MVSTELLTRAVAIAATTALLAGCPSTSTIPDPEPTDETYGSAGGGADSRGGEFDDFGSGEEVPFDPSASELSNVIFFDFDSYEVSAEDAELVNRHSVPHAHDPGRAGFAYLDGKFRRGATGRNGQRRDGLCRESPCGHQLHQLAACPRRS